MEIEKYKTFGELKVGDKIIAFNVTTNDKHVHEVSKIEKERDCNNIEFVRCWLGKPNPYRVNRICVPALAYVTQCTWIIYTPDVDNADKIIEEMRINEKREQEEESKRMQLEAIREQARKNPPRFIALNMDESNEEFIINVDDIGTVSKNFRNLSLVFFKDTGETFTVSNDYEEIKAKLGL